MAKVNRIEISGSERTESMMRPVVRDIHGSSDRRSRARQIASGKPIRQVVTKMNRVSARPPQASSPT
jgi:hypothetical protein